MANEELLEGIRARRQLWGKRDSTVRASLQLIKMQDNIQLHNRQAITIATSEPRAQFNLATHMLSWTPEVIRLPVTSQDLAQRREMGLAERAAVGMWKQNTDWQRMRGNPSWRVQSARHLLLGFAATEWDIRLTPDGQPQFIAIPWNPMSVYPDFGGPDKELIACDYTYTITRDALRRAVAYNEGWQMPRAMERSERAPIRIIKHYETDGVNVSMAVVANEAGDNEDIIMPLTYQPHMTEIPVVIMPIFDIDDMTSDTPNIDGFLMRNETNYKRLNLFMSEQMDVAHLNAYRSVQITSSTGRTTVDKEQLRGEVIPTTPDVMFNPIQAHGTTLNYLMGATQRNQLPFQLFGDLPFELSGTALMLIMPAATYALGVYKQAGEHMQAMITHKWLERMRHLELTDVALQGHSDRGFFSEAFSYKDIPDSNYPEVEWPLAVPQDLPTKIGIARQAVPQGQLLSRQRVMEEVIGIEDAMLEHDRISEDRLDDLPQITMLDALTRADAKIADMEQQGLDATPLIEFVEGLRQQLRNPEGQEQEEEAVPPGPTRGPGNMTGNAPRPQATEPFSTAGRY